MAGQLLQGGAQVAVVVQAVDQIAHQTGAPLLQLEPVQLPAQEAGQRLFQPPAGADPGQRVQLLIGELLVEPILPVIVLQPAQAAQDIVPVLRLRRRAGGLVQLHQGVLLGQLPDISLQLQGAQPQQLHAVQLPLAQSLRLCLLQLHRFRLPHFL